MKPGSDMDIRDIKAPVDIPDWSHYLLWGAAAVALVVLGWLLYRLLSNLLAHRKVNEEKILLEKLYAIDWSDPKKAAYEATKYGRALAKDDRRKELFSQLLPLLERYKYRKSVEKVDSETISAFELYRRICDESI
jgi:hypothetical protein